MTLVRGTDVRSGMSVLTSMFLTLAQATPPWAVRDPDPLPDASWFDRLVLESPGAIVAGIALLVVALILVGRRAAWGKRAVLIGACSAALGIGIIALSLVIQTDREAITQSSERITLAVANADRPVMEDLLASNLTVTYFGAPQGIGKKETIERVTTLRTNGVLAGVKATVDRIEASADNQRFGRSQVKVSASGDITGGYPTMSWWKLEWEKIDGTWKVVSVEPISIPGISNPSGR